MRQMEISASEDLGLIARLGCSHLEQHENLEWGRNKRHPHCGIESTGREPTTEGPLERGAKWGSIGATVDEVWAVRDVVMRICDNAGMRKLEDTDVTGWGWREDVATPRCYCKNALASWPTTPCSETLLALWSIRTSARSDERGKQIKVP
ncbi:hypothetical protein VTL71DRAFT_8231 [Oculimacula yallundae]|uniref:Uncharacterized protein n=1 Tax=Oculimacula yallundae TaxID=86028 RepID=A0ABR4CYJ1_9HELO